VTFSLHYFSQSILKALLGLPSSVEGALPTELGLLLNLAAFDLINLMSLRDSILSQLGQFSNLNILRISSSFEDNIAISSFLSYLPPNLKSLFLEGNSFIGKIPTELSSLVQLTYLNIFDARLTGTLPSEIGLMTNLQTLTISGIFLRGYIPSEIGKLTLLRYLLLENNQFSNIEVSNLVTMNTTSYSQDCLL
jgi:hypothetical protein